MSLKNMNRAMRRHNTQRLKKKRQSYWGGCAGLSVMALGKVVATPHPCSCWMCGHQRKHHGLTIQEKKVLQDF